MYVTIAVWLSLALFWPYTLRDKNTCTDVVHNAINLLLVCFRHSARIVWCYHWNSSG